MKTTLIEVRKLINKLAEQIQVPQYLLPTYENNTLEGTHVELDKSGLLYYFATERGKEIFRYLAKDVDDLLYKIFENATLMASNYELKQRLKRQDTRRIMFDEQRRLLGVLNKQWTVRRLREVELILIEHPFDDNASDSVSYYQQLVKKGQHPGNEWLVASEKYPIANKFVG